MKIFGIPIKIDPSFFVLSALLSFSRISEPVLLVVWLVVVLFSVLAHEFGHALAARAFGQSPSILLYSMGGLTSFGHAEARLHPLKNLLVTLAGPAAGLLVGALVYVAWPAALGAVDSLPLAVAYSDLLWVNVAWSVFNLLPVLPLDGGHVVASLEEWFTGRREQPVAHAVSLLAAAALALWALSAGSLWITFLGGMFAYANGSHLWRMLQGRRDARLQPTLAGAREAVEAGDLDRAFRLLTEVGREAKSESVKREAARLLVFAHIREGDYERAEHDLNRYEALYGADAYLRGLLPLARGDGAAAVADLQAAFDESASKETGLPLFRALVAAERFSDAAALCAHPALVELSGALRVELQSESFRAGDFATSARAGAEAFAERPDPAVAYNAACAHARLGDAESALAWLGRAADAGYDDAEQLASDPDLESLRPLPDFRRVLGRLLGEGAS